MVAQNVLAIGDRVSFDFGTRRIEGTVVGIRGDIGVNRARIYSVRIPNDPYVDEVIELPEDELTLEKGTVGQLSVDEIVEYLIHGGLLQMLNSNLSGGKNQPLIWLTRDSLGNVIHTFHAERGMVGGNMVPFHVLHGGQIFVDRVDQVVMFLESFGLSKRKAKDIVDAIGTSPS